MKALFLLSELERAARSRSSPTASRCRSPRCRARSTASSQRGFVARRECEQRPPLQARSPCSPQGRDVLDRLIAAREAALDGVRRRAARRRARRRCTRHSSPSPKGSPPMTERLRLSEDNRRWWTLGAMSFALFMVMLDNTAVNVALPSIQKDFGASLSALEWTVNAYTLTFAVLLVTGGRLGDIFGRRRMFLFGVVVFALASATIGFAPSDGWLVASRAIQGIGAAFMMPGTLSIISNAFPPEERGKAIGTWAGVSAIALAVGPLRRRLADRGGLLARDLLHQPARRRRRGRRDAVRGARVARRDRRAAASTSPASPTMTVGADRARLRARRGQRAGAGARPAILGLLALSAVAFVAFVVDRAARPRRRSWTSRRCAPSSSWARTSSPSWSRSGCSRCSSSSRSTCRTSSATARSRPASASSPRRS